MLSFHEFIDLLQIAQQHSHFETFQLAAAKHIDYSARTGERTAQLIWAMKYAHLNIRSIRGISQLSQAEFADRYGISQRSVENWEGGQRRPPEYLVNLLAYAVYSDALANAPDIYPHRPIEDGAGNPILLNPEIFIERIAVIPYGCRSSIIFDHMSANFSIDWALRCAEMGTTKYDMEYAMVSIAVARFLEKRGEIVLDSEDMEDEEWKIDEERYARAWDRSGYGDGSKATSLQNLNAPPYVPARAHYSESVLFWAFPRASIPWENPAREGDAEFPDRKAILDYIKKLFEYWAVDSGPAY